MKIIEAVQSHMINYLLQLCKKEIGFSQLPPIKFINEPHVPNTTSFGVFDGKSIQVVILNRHPIDISRTLAHELVHWHQQISGEELDGTTGSNTENDANAIAGVILRKFGEMYPEYFMDSLVP
jgi:hypothetical protein